MRLFTTIFTLLLYINLNANTQRELIVNAYNEYKAGNYLTALNLYKKECYRGSSTACASIGAMYLEGIGHNRNIEKARRYLNMSCISGNEYGCDILKKIKFTIITAKEKHTEKEVILPTSQRKYQKWRKADFSIKDAKFYISKNISLTEAKKWKKALFHTKDAYYYISHNISIKEAILRIKNK